MAYEIVIAGVGGQGVVFMSKILAKASEGEVKLIANKGHAKREGSVTVHLKIGRAYSPIINPGDADMVVGLEPLEVLRNAHLAKENAYFLVEKKKVIPVSCSLGETEYPQDVEEKIKRFSDKVYFVRAFDEDYPRNFNIVMLGVMASVPGFPVPADRIRAELEKAGRGLGRHFDKGIEIMKGML